MYLNREREQIENIRGSLAPFGRAQRSVSRSGLVTIVIIPLLAASLCIWLAWDLFRR